MGQFGFVRQSHRDLGDELPSDRFPLRWCYNHPAAAAAAAESFRRPRRRRAAAAAADGAAPSI